MTNIEKLIEEYGIEIIKRIPEKYSNLNYVIIYGVQISMYELVEHLKMSEYIASYKHLIGCEVFGLPKGRYIIGVSDPDFCAEYNIPLSMCDNADYLTQFKSMSEFKFYLDDETLGTYKEYMQLHYPEYKHIWKHQL